MTGGRLDRFKKLEPEQRRDATPSAGEDGTTGDARESPLEDRFGAGDDADGRPFDPPDEDSGQLFVRCALCKKDSDGAAEACPGCGASFSTPEQRAFNEGFWKERRAERTAREEERRRVREERARAEAEALEARRLREERLREEAERRPRETPLDNWTGDPLGSAARSVGRNLGAWAVRVIPDPRARSALLVSAIIALPVAFWVSPIFRSLVCSSLCPLLVLAMLAGGWRRRRGRRGRF